LIGSIDAAKTIVQGMINLRDEIKLRENAIELSTKLMNVLSSAIATQTEQASLLDDVQKLKEKIEAMEEWGREKARYDLKTLDAGVLVYTIKPDAQNSEPPHHICPTCYQRAHKSLLQPETRYPGRISLLHCNECGSEFLLSGGRHPDNPRPNVIRGRQKR
jgi:hypothetical protein